MRQWLVPGVCCACFFLAMTGAAQEVVHALSGTVTSIDPQAKTIQLNTDDGSEGTFHLVSNPSVSLNFDKQVRDEATPAESFNKTRTRVLLYFYGNQSVRTAVAIQDLGSGPFVTAQGTVTRVDKHSHAISIKDASGKSETFQVGPKAVADGMDGVEPGDRFDPDKGADVRLVATPGKGGGKAIFLRRQ